MKYLAILGTFPKTEQSNANEEKKAFEHLGYELAKAGFGLHVYDGSQEYIEHFIVKGFVRYFSDNIVEQGSSHLILFFVPNNDKAEKQIADFKIPEGFLKSHCTRVGTTTTKWRVAQFKSFIDADGFIFYYPGQAASMAWMYAVSEGKPILTYREPVDNKEGIGEDLFLEMLNKSSIYPENVMKLIPGKVTHEAAIPNSIQALKNQLQRKKGIWGNELRVHTVLGIAGIIWVVLLGLGIYLVTLDSASQSDFLQKISPGLGFALMVFGPIFSGIVGYSFYKSRTSDKIAFGSILRSGMLGVILAFILFFPNIEHCGMEVLDLNISMFLFGLISGLIGGYHLERASKLFQIPVPNG